MGTFLIDDDYVDPTTARQEPSEATRRDLKQFIKAYVAAHGHRCPANEVAAACHNQFPGAFTWGEIEQAMEVVQRNWDERRAAREANNPGTP